MASYTDILPEFKEYVPKYPLELIAQVGAQKQQKYEENVQKIQGQIDQVAGLDIYKDIDRNYLQSKLNELGNNMTMFAAGDFSNFQLVNSVSGMTKQLVRDPNIQNAVESTRKIRNEQKFMEEERKKGTLHRNNEIYFNDEIGRYLSSNAVGEKFNGRYQPYTDYQKKWRDIKKELDIKEDTSDLPFVMKDGKVVIGANGKPIVNDYMVRETFKGIDPNRLKQAIMSSMDDNDFRQMQIDSYVQYKGYTPDMLAEIAKDKFESNEKPLIQTIDRLNLLKNQASGDQKRLDAINKQLAQYNSRLENDRVEFEESLKNLYANPEEFKNKIFRMDSINQFANSFSNISHIQQIVDSPIRKQMNEDRDYNYKIVKFQTDNAHWQKDYNLNVAKFKSDEDKRDFDKKLEAYKLGIGPNPFGPTAGKYIGAAPTDQEFLDGMVESFKQDADLEQLKKDQNVLKNQWAKNQPPGTDLEKAFALALDTYRKDPNSKLGASTKTILAQYDKLDKLQKLKANAIADATQQAEALHPEYKTAVATLANNKVDFVGWRNVFLPDGRRKPGGELYTMLSKSQAEIYNDIKTGDAKLYIDQGQITLSYPKQNIDYSIPRYGTSVVGSEKTKALLLDLSQKFKSINQVEKAKDADFLRILSGKINAIAPVSEQLPVGSAGKFSTLIENKFAREQKGETEEATGFVVGKDFNIDNVRSLVLDKETIPSYTTFGDDVYITLSGKIKDKPVTQKFKLSKSEFATSFPGVITDDVNIDFLKSSAANGSTNYRYHLLKEAEQNPEDAFATANYGNKNTRKYIVKGDVFFDQNDKNNTIPVIYVKNPRTGNVISISSENFNTFTNSQTNIGKISDLEIDNYLKNNNLDANF